MTTNSKMMTSLNMKMNLNIKTTQKMKISHKSKMIPKIKMAPKMKRLALLPRFISSTKLFLSKITVLRYCDLEKVNLFAGHPVLYSILDKLKTSNSSNATHK